MAIHTMFYILLNHNYLKILSYFEDIFRLRILYIFGMQKKLKFMNHIEDFFIYLHPHCTTRVQF